MRSRLLEFFNKENHMMKNRKITFESGPPENYQGEFMKLWLTHMEYLNKIQTFKYKSFKFTPQVFNESLQRFKNNHSETRLFVAKENDELVGALQVGIAPNGHYGFISDLHVLERYRGLGVGERLVNECLGWLKQRSINEIGLEVAGGNERVLDFYKKFGFQIETYKMLIEK